jgi:hypothetical protein
MTAEGKVSDVSGSTALNIMDTKIDAEDVCNMRV